MFSQADCSAVAPAVFSLLPHQCALASVAVRIAFISICSRCSCPNMGLMRIIDMNKDILSSNRMSLVFYGRLLTDTLMGYIIQIP